ncbi:MULTISPECIES: isopenicillin N synthase family dioxygenase [Mycobacteriaceae]|uniref:2OG-Fe(II) oxygenase n=1 Tax=Mycolicibacterium neoaurum VKM Ac-1815D TaxID=700508 RepID=V5XAQ9_MYCNE|nr:MULTISPECIES: 2-oxoglutarate and iron-dependent oxygenase domain-containing protein [Mycobacteriaceae]AHC24766.1 2OG-Fe(II) oxygenase [Mycolicibacterium neoaurum VKM Ac-1815D]AMO05315.1 2OG-Fe(II) oxygenase [Mycolicibacterium neoaurum]AXK76371.1 isopenicillin N synthase family oxygenase [Mycolicibacterium neoaurum]KJQ50836.1 2OG-Fe(II) oxygenase [Mycolicibacterium neoaurum]KUM10033.1 2OG-Fe(II) oxygenase [Mycolicibacterium neoaurum]
MTADFTEVPVLDIAALLDEDHPDYARSVADLGDAARRVGFAQIIGHGISSALFDDLLTATRTFFALPEQEKLKVHIGHSSNHRGYVPPGEEVFAAGTVDAKEAFDLSVDLPADDPRYLAGHPLLGPNQWPELAGFREAVTAWYKAVFALSRRLLRAFAVALGEPADRFDRHVTAPPSQLRLIHYPFDPAAADRPGIGAHTDYECFTLLRPTAPGLEVLNAAGTWIDVPLIDDAFVINIGDLLEIWSNGEFVATTHRVRKVVEERFSFPLFVNVDDDTEVAPLPALAVNGKPARTPVIAGEHLFAQTAQSFRYLQERLARGEVTLPEGAHPLATFGRKALTSH